MPPASDRYAIGERSYCSNDFTLQRLVAIAAQSGLSQQPENNIERLKDRFLPIRHVNCVGLIVRGIGDTIDLWPTLISTVEEIDMIVDRFARTLHDVAKNTFGC